MHSISLKCDNNLLDKTYKKYEPKIGIEIPSIHQVIPDIYKESPNIDPLVLLLANIDYIAGFTSWDMDIRYELYKDVDIKIFNDNISEKIIRLYIRLRLLNFNNINKDRNSILVNLNLNPITFYESMQTFVEKDYNVLVSAVYKPKTAISLNFLYILYNIANCIQLFRPYMVTGENDVFIVIAKVNEIKTLDKEYRKDLLNRGSKRIQYLTKDIPQEFKEYINKSYEHIDNSRGWGLTIPGYY